MATPIGNLADLTLRAIHVLGLVDAVACEDTRHSGALLRHLGIDKPLLALHEHNEREASAGVLARLGAGERIAYVSDAGTPAISDPGAVLVAAAQSAGYRTVPIPGVSSVAAALSVAGNLPVAASGQAVALAGGAPAAVVALADFSFLGFLSTRAGDRNMQLAAMASRSEAQVLFEAPHRIEALARSLADACPTRRVTLCRELTKQFETVVTLPADAVPQWLHDGEHRTRGEFVIVLHALAPAEGTADELALHERTLRTLMGELPLKQAVALTAELTGAPRNALYQRALVIKGDSA